MEYTTQTVRADSATTNPQLIVQAPPVQSLQTSRVLRNTYALLAMTLLFSAGVAATSLTLKLPAPGIVLTLAGYFGLLFAVYKLKNSGWALPAVFALTGFMGYTLGPVLSQSLALPGGGQVVTMVGPIVMTGHVQSQTFFAYPLQIDAGEDDDFGAECRPGNILPIRADDCAAAV